MKKIGKRSLSMTMLLFAVTLIGAFVSTYSVSASTANDLKNKAIQSNDLGDLKAFLSKNKSTKYTKIKNIQYSDNEYLVFVLKGTSISNKSKVHKLAKKVNSLMVSTPTQFYKNGVAFIQKSDETDYVLTYSSSEIEGLGIPKNSKLVKDVNEDQFNLFGDATSYYAEPNFASKNTDLFSNDSLVRVGPVDNDSKEGLNTHIMGVVGE